MPTYLRLISIAAFVLYLPSFLPAQVTYGKKPQLPPPFSTKSADNSSDKEQPPDGFLPTVPQGFRVNVYASGFRRPRWLIQAPNGDMFLAETGGGRIVVLRAPNNSGTAQREVFAEGLRQPFGIAFHD